MDGMNDSRRSGALKALSSKNADDPIEALRFFVASLTGLPMNLVRRRWQLKPGTRPGMNADWASVGVEKVTTAGTPQITGVKGVPSDPASGISKTETHQMLEVRVAFYGPNALTLADAFRDACGIGQNNQLLKDRGLTLQSVSEEAVRLPDLVFEQWCDRYEIVLRVGRKATRIYGVRDIATAVGAVQIITEH